MAVRKCTNVIGSFLDITKDAPTPYIYRKWAALGAITATMTRRCWTNTENGPMYPNMMVLLVGKPSVGKGPALRLIEIILKSLDFSSNPIKRFSGIRMGVQDTTAPGLLDDLLDDESLKRFDHKGKSFEFRSLTLVSEELSTLMHSIDHRFMGYLVKLLNCEALSTRLRKDGERKEVDNPALSILGGVQPKVLHQIFPASAWSMGLTARAVFVFSDQQIKVPVFGTGTKPKQDDSLLADLTHDFEQIASLSGSFDYPTESMDRINDWWLNEADKSKPKHPLLADNYGGKRIFQLVRLSMAHSAARNNDMVVGLQDVNMAIDSLLEVEAVMPRIFESMGDEYSSSDAIADIAHRVQATFLTTGNAVPHHILQSMISQKVAIYNVEKVLTQLLEEHLIKEVRSSKRLPGAGGRKAYVPANAEFPPKPPLRSVQ